MIRAFLVTLVTFAYILILGPPVLIYAAIRGDGDLVYRVGTLGARMALWLAGTRLEIHGLDQIPSDRPVVFMANHQSNFDPPALLAVLPPVLVLVKKEFFRVPILGRAMVACGFILVDRRNREQALEARKGRAGTEGWKVIPRLSRGHSQPRWQASALQERRLCYGNQSGCSHCSHLGLG